MITLRPTTPGDQKQTAGTGSQGADCPPGAIYSAVRDIFDAFAGNDHTAAWLVEHDGEYRAGPVWPTHPTCRGERGWLAGV